MAMGDGITLEKLQVIIEGYIAPYKEALEEVKKKTDSASSHVQKKTANIANSFKKVAKVIGAVVSMSAIVAFGKSCVELGSNLAEVQNVVDVTFGSMNKNVDQFAKNAIDQFGLSELATKKYMGTYGAMAKSFGFDTSSVYNMSAAITGLTGDVASFYNLSTDEAYTKLKSIFTGETESLKELGVVMTQTALDQYALNNGFGKTTAKMTEQEKVMLRYQFVMSQLSDATGDFARTSNSWANQTKVLALRFEQLKATVGQGLINALTPALKVINTLLAKLQVLAEYFKAFTTALFGDAGGSGTSSVASDMAAVADSTAAATEAAKEYKNQVMGFDQINILSDNSTSSSTGASGSGEIAGFDFGTTATDNLIDTSGVEKAVQKIKAALEPLTKFNLSSLKTAFEEVAIAAAPLTEKVSSGLSWLYENVLVPLAGWTIEDALPAFFNALGEAFDFVNEVIDAFEPLATWLWDEFLQPIAEWTGGVIVDTLDGIANSLDKVSSWMSDNQQTVQDITTAVALFFAAWKLTELLGFIQMSGGVVGAFASITAAIWACTGAKLVDKLETMAIYALYAVDFVKAIIAVVTQKGVELAAWIASTAAKVADTAATTAATAATWLFNAALAVLTSPITWVIAAIAALIAIVILLVKNWDTVKEAAIKVWTIVQEKFQQFDDFLTRIFTTDFTKCFGAFGNVLNSFFVTVRQIWNSVKQIFSGIITFIKGVFTGNWKQAWEGVKQIFAGVFNAFSAIVKAPLNAVIGLINGAISGLNSISVSIPDWVPVLGGRYFGISLPSIPYLEKGGIVSQATLAMIGENGREAVMPLEKNTGWIDQLADQIAARNGGSSLSKKDIMDVMIYVFERYMQIDFYLGDEKLAKHAKAGAAKFDRRLKPT